MKLELKKEQSILYSITVYRIYLDGKYMTTYGTLEEAERAFERWNATPKIVTIKTKEL